MTLVWRLWTAPALVAGLMMVTASGCKSGGGWWSPGSSRWGSAESSTSDLAVSRPPTRVPTPSSGAKPTTPDDLASTRGATGTQDGPYGAGATAAAGSSSYGTKPAGWQSEPHSSVAPAGGYQTGQYCMASNPRPQPGVTPGAYAQPSTQGTAGAYPAEEAAAPNGQAYGQPDPDVGAADGASAAPAAEEPAGSIYQDPSASGGYAAADPSSAYGAPPPSDAPGAVSEPASTVPETPLYSPASTYDSGENSNPAADATTPPAAAVANPYTLSGPSTRPPTSPTASLPTSPVPTTSPTTAITPYDPPALPSSLSATPGSYRPGSTAAPGTIYGTGYDTTDGTMMR